MRILPSCLAVALLLAFSPFVAVADAACACDPDVDGNGAIMIQDWICIRDCIAGNCACCVNSCDVNCDGVVDHLDAGVDPLGDNSAWLCLFQGGPFADCCRPPVVSTEEPTSRPQKHSLGTADP